MRRKITIVGGDSLAAIVALLLAERDYADVVLLDETQGAAPETAPEVRDAAAVIGCEPRVTAASSWGTVAGSNIVVLGDGDADTIEQAAAQLARVCPDAIVIVAAAPPDAVALTLDRTLFPRQRVIGCWPLVASARLRAALATELGASIRDVQALVLGGPGEAAVPVVSATTVAGIPVLEWLAPERLAELVERACRDGAAHTRSSSVQLAAAAAVRELVDALAADGGRVLPCAVQCRGEYGLEPVVLGVPSRLGASGVEEIVELGLSATERADLQRAAAVLRPAQPLSDRPSAAPARAR